MTTTPGKEPPSPARPQRALALDALRGIAILAMCLSGVVPFYANTLPDWMYHAQLPPPTHRFNPELPGYTWVDLVFPMFLFAMGAAFPLAMTKRLERGERFMRSVLGMLGRGLSLAAFAVFIQNMAPYHMSRSPDPFTWTVALAAFFLLFPIYSRYPASWPTPLCWMLRLLGVLLAFLLMDSVMFPDGSGWSVQRRDIIIMVLANMAFFGGIAWLLTRGSWLARLLLMGGVYAALQASTIDGSFVRHLATNRLNLGAITLDLGWLYNFAWLKYLFIVLPGSIAGDQLLRWMRARKEAGEPPERGAGLLVLSAWLLALVVFLHIGLQARWTILTPSVTFAALLVGWAICRTLRGYDAELVRSLFLWGCAWLAIGLLFEPTEGGIKKDPSTMSYYFVSSGLSVFLLICLTIWIDLFRCRKPFAILIANGQNPMIAYAGIRNFLAPVVNLTGLQMWWATREWITPWLLFGWALIKTAFLGAVVALFTRWKIYWRT